MRPAFVGRFPERHDDFPPLLRFRRRLLSLSLRQCGALSHRDDKDGAKGPPGSFGRRARRPRARTRKRNCRACFFLDLRIDFLFHASWIGPVPGHIGESPISHCKICIIMRSAREEGTAARRRGRKRAHLPGATRQIVPLPSSLTRSAPSCATATLTGRPQTRSSSTTKPVRKSSYAPSGTPSRRWMRMTL